VIVTMLPFGDQALEVCATHCLRQLDSSSLNVVEIISDKQRTESNGHIEVSDARARVPHEL